jgi:hypothetical protein
MTVDVPTSNRADELAIRDLAYRYARMVDRRDWSEIPRVFTPDCELMGTGYRMRGHAELAAGLQKIDMFSATQHCVHNQITCLDGDRATGEFYCVANHIHVRDGVEYKLDMGIRYEDRYVRTADGWRLEKRVLNLIWQQDLPLDFSVASVAKAARAAKSGKLTKAAGTARSVSKRAGSGRSAARKAAGRGATAKKAAARSAGSKKAGRKGGGRGAGRR